ncbi:MAG: FGGY family carbohydrate kinase [Bacillota bacterium]|nr:FGGY family carbohydrate kinase [Bacillota bacterium]
MVLIGIDLGTTGCKCVACAGVGSVLGERYFEYDLIHTPEGWILQDAEQWWQLVCQAIKETVHVIGPEAARDIQGMSISSQGIAVVPVDRAGNVLDRAISWLDKRATDQTEQIRQAFGDQEIFRRTGKRISPAYTLPKLMWLKQNKPAIYDETAKFLLPLDFINQRLTGHAVTDFAMASGTMAFDIRNGVWDGTILQTCGIDRNKLPPVAVAGSYVGMVRPDVAVSLGMPETTRVFLGTQDQKCAALAAGITTETATISLGTASAISTMSSHPQDDEKMRIPCFALGQERWILESVVGTACVSLKWLRKMITPNLDYAEMDQLAATVAPGANGVSFLPHMEGAGTPFWQSDQHGSFHGLSLATEQADLIRALLEGVAFQVQTNLSVQEEVNGIAIKELRLFGGGSHSALWCAIMADVTNRPVLQMQAELANFGAVLLADEGIGQGKTDGHRFTAIKDPVRVFRPDPNRVRQYQAAYSRYCAIEKKLMV